MYSGVFSAAQLATIAANVSGTGFSVTVPSRGMRSYRFLNMTSATLYLYDDAGHLLDVCPAIGYGRTNLPDGTLNVTIQFDPALSGNAPGTAFTQANNWQFYLELFEHRARDEEVRGA